MKSVALLLLPLLLALMSGCSFLDQLQLNDQNGLDPNKIYLHNETVRGTRSELDRYSCLSGEPMVCVGSTTTLHCRC